MIQTISIHTNVINAHIVRARLESEGIPAYVAFEHQVWAKWSMSLAIGGVRVQVPSPYVDEALEVLAAIQSGQYQADLIAEFDEEDLPVCPQCCSQRLRHINWPWKLALILVFFTIIPFLPYTQHMMSCQQCSHKWIAAEQRGYPLYIQFFALVLFSILLIVCYDAWFYWCQLHCE